MLGLCIFSAVIPQVLGAVIGFHDGSPVLGEVVGVHHHDGSPVLGDVVGPHDGSPVLGDVVGLYACHLKQSSNHGKDCHGNCSDPGC